MGKILLVSCLLQLLTGDDKLLIASSSFAGAYQAVKTQENFQAVTVQTGTSRRMKAQAPLKDCGFKLVFQHNNCFTLMDNGTLISAGTIAGKFPGIFLTERKCIIASFYHIYHFHQYW